MWQLFGLFICFTFLNVKSIASYNLTLMDFLKDIKNTHNFNTLLFLKNRGVEVSSSFLPCSNLDCNFEQILWLQLQVPLLQLDETKSYLLKQHFNDCVFAICYLEGDWQQDSKLLNKLLINLHHMRDVKTIFLLNQEIEEEAFLEHLFKFCWQGKMLNIVAVYASFQTTNVYYRYTHFPIFEIEKMLFDLSEEETIYPDRVKDLKGFQLPIILADIPPRMIVKSQNKNGDFELGGTVGNLMNLLTEKRNLTYKYPIPVKDTLELKENDVDWVRNETAEFSTRLHMSNWSYDGFSYPMEVVDWCIMMPVPADVPRSEFFLIIFSWETFLIALTTLVIISMLLSLALHRHGQRVNLTDFFLHYNCLRGLLGQAFIQVRRPTRLIRGIYLKICLLGILLTTFYNAYFSTYLTKAPTQRPLLTIEDIHKANFKVYGLEHEINYLIYMRPEFSHLYSQVFIGEPNTSKFVELRDSFNTNFGYLIPMEKWSIIHEQQKMFGKPLFHRPESLCIIKILPLAFPINENSYFTQSLNRFILHVMEVGLLDYWHEHLFYELLRVNINFTDLSRKVVYQPIKAKDFNIIFMGMIFMFFISTLIFLAELKQLLRTN